MEPPLSARPNSCMLPRTSYFILGHCRISIECLRDGRGMHTVVVDNFQVLNVTADCDRLKDSLLLPQQADRTTDYQQQTLACTRIVSLLSVSTTDALL